MLVRGKVSQKHRHQLVDRTGCPIDMFGCKAAQTQVRSLAVVAPDGFIDPSLQARGRDLQRVQVFVLDDAVDSFGHRVVLRVPCLCHGDDAAVLVQQRDIPVRAVLASPVRMVYDRQMSIHKIPVVERLPEHIKGIFGPHVVADLPADDAPGIEIGHQEYVEASAFHEQVSDIGHPNLIGTADHQSLHAVGIGPQAVPREGRTPMADTAPKEQTVAVKHIEQPITSHLDAVVTFKHDLEFARTYAGMALAYLVHKADDHVLLHTFLAPPALGLVLSLPCMAKQLTQGIPCLLGMPLFQQARYLAPVFFLIGIL